MTEDTLTLAEAAQKLRVSVRTLEREIKDGKLAVIKVRSRRRIAASEIERFRRISVPAATKPRTRIARPGESRSIDVRPIVQMARPVVDACGIYFLVHQDDVVYVGKSLNVYARVQQHLQQQSKSFDRWCFFSCPPADLDRLEGYYIKAIRPLHNVTYPVCAPCTDEELREAVDALGRLTAGNLLEEIEE